jgi:hypothetical protein
MTGATVLGMPLEMASDDDQISQPLAAIVVVKCLNADGSIGYRSRATTGVQTVEALGMARYAVLKLEQAILQRGGDDDD